MKPAFLVEELLVTRSIKKYEVTRVRNITVEWVTSTYFVAFTRAED